MTTTLDAECRIETATSAAGCAVELAGTLNWRSAPGLRAALGQVRSARRLIDLTEVEAIDSAGTGALIAASSRAHRDGAQLALLTGGSVADVVDGVGLTDSVLVFTDRAAAYAWLQGERAGYPLGR